MAGDSHIEWTDATWNPIVGCSIVSPGCINCYAMKDAWRKHHIPAMPHYHGLTKKVNGNAVWTGKITVAPDHILTAPLHWRKPRRIFVNSMGDLFHEAIPDAAIDKVVAVMALSPLHTYQALTKRAARMREYFAALQNISERDDRIGVLIRRVSSDDDICLKIRWPLANVWLGVSAERQQEADERIPHLLQTPAAVRFVSAEPLLGPIDFMMLKSGDKVYDVLQGCIGTDIGDGEYDGAQPCNKLDWIIVGGESGPTARHIHPKWASDIRDQCASAGVPFFFKQWGAFQFETRPGTEVILPDLKPNQCALWGDGATNHIVATRVGKKAAGRLLDGQEHNGFPTAARTQDEAAALVRYEAA